MHPQVVIALDHGWVDVQHHVTADAGDRRTAARDAHACRQAVHGHLDRAVEATPPLQFEPDRPVAHALTGGERGPAGPGADARAR
jgi:hypothetical protein